MPTSRTPGSVTVSRLVTVPVGATRRSKNGEDDQERRTMLHWRHRVQSHGGEQRIDLGIIESEFGAHVTGGTESRCGPDIRNRHAGRMEPGPLEGQPPIGGWSSSTIKPRARVRSPYCPAELCIGPAGTPRQAQ